MNNAHNKKKRDLKPYKRPPQYDANFIQSVALCRWNRLQIPGTTGKSSLGSRWYFRNTFQSVGELNLSLTNKSRECHLPATLPHLKNYKTCFSFRSWKRWQYRPPNKCTEVHCVEDFSVKNGHGFWARICNGKFKCAAASSVGLKEKASSIR